MSPKGWSAPAQRALNAIVNWQGQDGGFRYSAKQMGDMSVSSWHIQALHAGKQAGLDIPKATWAGVGNFLDKVGNQDGSGYGYTGPQPTLQRMTAAGLFCRQEATAWGLGPGGRSVRQPVRSARHDLILPADAGSLLPARAVVPAR
ncbi:MAG: hypothetical protein K2R98_05640 [Gemmataceae bacterium]|nr:hypothetical protein [Gemmataceae bacterium]